MLGMMFIYQLKFTCVGPDSYLTIKLNLTKTSWAKLLGTKVSLSDVLQDVNDLTEKEREKVISLLSSFDLVSLQR